MKKVLIAVLAVLTLNVFATYIEKPDDNTLWIENGECEGDGQLAGWRDGVAMKHMEKGGFTMQPGTGHDGGRYVLDSADYPWLVCELASIEHLTGYKGFLINGGMGMVSNPMPGIFATKKPVATQNKRFLRVDIHGLVLGFKYFKQVKQPDNYIEYEETADGMKITVYLKDLAEDVSISFYDAYCMPRLRIGGLDKLQLYPTDEDKPLVWTATLKDFNYTTKGNLLLKATVLGSNTLKTPIWNQIPKKK